MTSIKSISLKEMYRLLLNLIQFALRNWKWMVAFGVVGGILGFSYASIKKIKYKSHLSFLINENESSPVNLSSLAGLAGLGAMNTGGVNEDKLMFLTTSRYIIGSSLLKTVATPDGKKEVIGNQFIRVYRLNKIFAKDTLFNHFKGFYHTSIDSLNSAENKATDIIVKLITDAKLLKIEGKKKTGLVSQNAGIVTIDFTCPDETLAKVFVDELYEVLSTHYINKTIQRHLRNYQLISHRADSLKWILTDKENIGASVYDQNLNVARMKARVKLERTRKDLEMLNLMYGEVLKNLEIAKFNLENQTPVLQLVDTPTFPLPIEVASKIVYTIVGIIALTLAGYCFLLVRHFIRFDSF